MFYESGGLFGWLLIITIAGAIFNYCFKLVNKQYGNKISTFPKGKNIMKVLMTIFVRYHRYFGGAAAVLLLVHVIMQFLRYGFNVTGGVAALLLIIQISLGLYAISKKKPRKGPWFITHRVMGVFLVFSIMLHLLLPNVGNGILPKKELVITAESVDGSELQTFTVEELAKYNGENGSQAYVAYKGIVYDVTNHPKWTEGKHNGRFAGTDLTNEISKSPHGDSKFNSLEVVGTITMP